MKSMHPHEKQWLKAKIEEHKKYQHQKLIKEIRRRNRNNIDEDIVSSLPGFLLKICAAIFVEVLN